MGGDPAMTCPCFIAPNRESAMIVVAPNVWCDPCIGPLIRALNDAGIQTDASCCGHNRNVGSVILSDGRVLAILPDLTGLDALNQHYRCEGQP